MIIGYARNATVSQLPRTGPQLDALHAHGAHHVITDTGKSFEGAGWQEIMDTLRFGDVLLVYSLDRISRDRLRLREACDTLAAQGVTVRAITGPQPSDLDNVFRA